MSASDDYAEASALLPHEDPDEIYDAAWSAIWQWMRKVEPFQPVRVRFATTAMAEVGLRVAGYLDVEERALRKAKSNARLREAIDRFFAIRREYEASECERFDNIASGW